MKKFLKHLLFALILALVIISTELVMKLSGTEVNLGYSVGAILGVIYQHWLKD